MTHRGIISTTSKEANDAFREVVQTWTLPAKWEVIETPGVQSAEQSTLKKPKAPKS